MRRYPLTFNLASGGAADGVSAPEIVGFCVSKTVQIGGTFSATVTIQGRVSPSDAWVDLTSVTAGAIYVVEAAVYDLQIVVSAYVSGTVTATFAGFNAQPG
jgi:aminoglycoside phosphotransferase (APT) family kinase protein